LNRSQNCVNKLNVFFTFGEVQSIVIGIEFEKVKVSQYI